MKPREKCLDVTPHFLQSKLIFKFRWARLTITIFTVKMPQGSYKRTKYAVNLPLYCVQLYGFVPGTKLPNWASNVKEAFFQNLSITMLCLSLDFHFIFFYYFTLEFGLDFTYSNYFLWLSFLLRTALYIPEWGKNKQRNVTEKEKSKCKCSFLTPRLSAF